jgi:tetratricopeptide (TPR) repeat protein
MLDIAQKTDSKPQEAKSFDGLGLVYTKVKKIITAISQFKQAKTFARQYKDQILMMALLQNMAHAHIKMGKPKRGIENLEAALILAKKNGEQEGPGYYIKKNWLTFTKKSRSLKRLAQNSKGYKF